jgi:protein involved in polysaccharide export with SLBB domain
MAMAKPFLRVSGLATLCLTAAAVFLGGCDAIADWTKTDAHRFFSPDEMVAPPERSPINPILNSISLVDQTQELVPNATFPTEGDWEYVEQDYVIGPTDVLDISILDLFQEGLETPLRREVSDTGYIDLPLLPERIKAEGLTKEELTEAIIQAYSPNIIRNPTVSVTLEARHQSTYYILGAVSRPSQYMIGRRDMRLLEALAISGGVVQNNIPYIYVIRPAPAVRKAAENPVGGKAGSETAPQPLPTLPELLPEGTPTQAKPTQPSPVTAPAATAPQPAVVRGTPPPSTEAMQRATTALQSNDLETALQALGKAPPPAAPAAQPAPAEKPAPSVMPRMTELSSGGAAQPNTIPANVPRWVYRDGKWIRATNEAPPQTTAPAQPAGLAATARPTTQAGPAAEAPRILEAPPKTVKVTMPPPSPQGPPVATEPVKLPLAAATSQPAKGEDPFGWRKASKSDMARIIAINLQKLNDGDPRQNIVIHDNDIIQVPYLPVGEFYVTGEVLRPGVYSLPSTPVTVKQALAAAGNVSQVAWPENSILIRRIGTSQEQIIPLNVESIFKGEEPDIFLKPNDVIAIGTDVRSTFFAVLRNAFRMTYGFGFIYDRNFSDPILNGQTPNSKRFTRL